jgi:uncharacterized protein YaaN involved in tellurite resistance
MSEISVGGIFDETPATHAGGNAAAGATAPQPVGTAAGVFPSSVVSTPSQQDASAELFGVSEDPTSAQPDANQGLATPTSQAIVIPYQQALQQSGLQIPNSSLVDRLETTRPDFTKAADRVLAVHKVSDLGTDMSDQMNKLISTARSMAVIPGDKDGNGKSVGSFFSKITARLVSEKTLIMNHLTSVQAEIDHIVAGLDQSVDRKHKMIIDIGDMKKELIAGYQQTDKDMQQVQVWLAQADEALKLPVPQGDIPGSLAKGELQQIRQRLAGLQEFYQNAKTFDQINGVELQTNETGARAIIDKFTMIKTQSIPFIKMSLANRLQALEQKKDQQTAANADAFTSDMIRQTADAVGASMIGTATMQASSSIKVEDEDYAISALEQASIAVRKIESAAEDQRKINASKQEELQKRILTMVAGG